MAALAPLPEIRRMAVPVVAIVVVNIGAVGHVERSPTTRADATGALAPDAVAVSVAMGLRHR
jgi:hypothetical protein